MKAGLTTFADLIRPANYTVLALLVAPVLLWVSPAHAHATIDARDAKAGAPIKVVIKIPHGCKGSPTVAVTADLPEGLIGVKPQPKPGWQLATTKGAYAKSYAYHGKTLTEGVRTIAWTGGPLLDEHFDEFVFQGFIAEVPAAGVIHVPVRQRCEAGEIYWAEVPAAGQDSHDLTAPAPVIKVAGGQSPADDPAGASVTVGALKIAQPWVRATPGGAKVGAGYLRITNTSDTPDRLIGASSAASDRVEIHEMREAEGGVMQMRQLEAGLEIPPNASVDLKPGGTHLMFMGLKAPMASQSPPPVVSLRFEKAGAADVLFAVSPAGAASPPGEAKHQH